MPEEAPNNQTVTVLMPEFSYKRCGKTRSSRNIYRHMFTQKHRATIKFTITSVVWGILFEQVNQNTNKSSNLNTYLL